MAAPIFMGAWHFLVLSAGKTPMPIKFLLLGGVFGFSRRGGRSAWIFPSLVGLSGTPFSWAYRSGGGGGKKKKKEGPNLLAEHLHDVAMPCTCHQDGKAEKLK